MRPPLAPPLTDTAELTTSRPARINRGDMSWIAPDYARDLALHEGAGVGSSRCRRRQLQVQASAAPLARCPLSPSRAATPPRTAAHPPGTSHVRVEFEHRPQPPARHHLGHRINRRPPLAEHQQPVASARSEVEAVEHHHGDALLRTTTSMAPRWETSGDGSGCRRGAPRTRFPPRSARAGAICESYDGDIRCATHWARRGVECPIRLVHRSHPTSDAGDTVRAPCGSAPASPSR